MFATPSMTIRAALLARLRDGQVHAWSELRPTLPGTRWAQVRVLCDLAASGAVDASKTDTDTFLSLPVPSRSVVA